MDSEALNSVRLTVPDFDVSCKAETSSTNTVHSLTVFLKSHHEHPLASRYIWWVGVRAVGDLGQGVVLPGANVGMHSTGQNETPEEVFLDHSLHYWLEMRSLTEPERCRLLWVAWPSSLWDPPVSPLRRSQLSAWVSGTTPAQGLTLTEQMLLPIEP